MSYLNKLKIENKKALSSVVITVLLILIGIAAIAIISTFLISYLNDSSTQLSPQISCLDMQSQTILKINSACLNSENNEIEISLTRSISDIKIENINFILSSERESSSWLCSESSNKQECGDCIVLNEGETKTYFFSLNANENPTSAIISIDSCKLNSREITPSCN